MAAGELVTHNRSRMRFSAWTTYFQTNYIPTLPPLAVNWRSNWGSSNPPPVFSLLTRTCWSVLKRLSPRWSRTGTQRATTKPASRSRWDRKWTRSSRGTDRPLQEEGSSHPLTASAGPPATGGATCWTCWWAGDEQPAASAPGWTALEMQEGWDAIMEKVRLWLEQGDFKVTTVRTFWGYEGSSTGPCCLLSLTRRISWRVLGQNEVVVGLG